MALPNNIKTALLAGGVNLVFSWYDKNNYNPTGFDQELPKIAALGAKHVRLCISMDIMEDGTTGKVKVGRYASLIRFLNLAKANNLVVIVDMHNTGQMVPGTTTWTDNYMSQLEDPVVRERHYSLLVDLAGKLGTDTDTDWVVLAPANEPIFVWGDENVWYDYQKRLIPAMRAAAKNLVIMSMAHDWQGIDATVWTFKTPFADDRVIVDVHFYEPMPLTHCKSDCASKTYPATIETWRGTETWNKARMQLLFKDLREWRDKHGVFVHCSEFGTQTALPEAVRAAYIGDVVSILRENGFGLTVYDWNTSKPTNFGINMHPKVLKAVFSTPVVEPPVDLPPSGGISLEQVRAVVREEIAKALAETAFKDSVITISRQAYSENLLKLIEFLKTIV